MTPAIIQWSLVGEVILVSFVAGIVVVALFATVILGSTRAADARRAGTGGAAGFTVLAIVAFAAFMAIVALAIVTMVNKS
jgi:hypothetical protein